MVKTRILLQKEGLLQEVQEVGKEALQEVP
jgi:hypothetical protein